MLKIKFTEKIKQIMKDSILNGDKTTTEYGFSLCKCKDNTIIPGKIRKGQQQEITTKTKCPKNTTDIGSFHTHPISFQTKFKPSIEDLSGGEGIVCVGHKKHTTCFTHKSEKSVNQVEDIVKQYEKSIPKGYTKKGRIEFRKKSKLIQKKEFDKYMGAVMKNEDEATKKALKLFNIHKLF